MFFGTASGLALGACFNPPAASVMFACDPADDGGACPTDYACEADGCCHRLGSDVEAELGACRIGGPGSASAASTGTGEPTGTDATTGTTTDATTGTTDATTGTTDATTTDAGTDTSTSTGATDTSTGTGDTSGSSSASSTG